MLGDVIILLLAGVSGAFAIGLVEVVLWVRMRRNIDGLLPNETFEYTLDTGDILQLFRDRSVLVAVLQDDGRRADMISLTLAEDVDFTTARMALLKAEQDGLRLVE